MKKYLAKRIIGGLLSIIAVTAIVMILIYSLMDRQLIFQSDALYLKKVSNEKTTYMYTKWREYGYVDMVKYSDFLTKRLKNGEITQEVFDAAAYPRTGKITKKEAEDNIQAFKDFYTAKGYSIIELPADMMSSGRKLKTGGAATLFAYKDIPVYQRLGKYLKSILSFDSIHYVDAEEDIGERKLTYTLYDPIYNQYNEDGTIAAKKFSPAILGNGTKHKYLLYLDGTFPFIHQNFVTLNLGKSYAVNAGIDVWDTMNIAQGSHKKDTFTYPSGIREETADDLHTATYVKDSLEANIAYQGRFTDDYTNVYTHKNGLSKVGYSFLIGILATILAYLLGLPLGIWMALRKDKLVDKLGTAYNIFILAVPSLAYIFMFKAIGTSVFHLPRIFDLDQTGKTKILMFILPIISLALPSIASLMKWLRRYMVDQMNSDYVKFARSGGLSEGEIFRKHILKNAMIPIIHGIPSSILGALTGAIITERVYSVPGAGNLLTDAINHYDNGVIVGLTLFYATLTVVGLLLGDLLMAAADPRISFDTKER
ncbi:MAG: ABC transporter permease [Lachnospiraceae bacterium]|nr:ABC transporter permease [Lachnospiraceae bacterium]